MRFVIATPKASPELARPELPGPGGGTERPRPRHAQEAQTPRATLQPKRTEAGGAQPSPAAGDGNCVGPARGRRAPGKVPRGDKAGRGSPSAGSEEKHRAAPSARAGPSGAARPPPARPRVLTSGNSRAHSAAHSSPAAPIVLRRLIGGGLPGLGRRTPPRSLSPAPGAASSSARRGRRCRRPGPGTPRVRRAGAVLPAGRCSGSRAGAELRVPAPGCLCASLCLCSFAAVRGGSVVGSVSGYAPGSCRCF